MKYMHTLVHGNWSTSRRQRYVECVGKLLPDYTDTRWSSACEAAQHHAQFSVIEIRWLYAKGTRKEEKERDKESATAQKSILQRAIPLIDRQRIIVHLQASFFSGFGKPVYEFLVGLRVDIVPKGCVESACRPFGHRLCTRVQALEAQPEAYAEDVSTVLGVQPILSLLRNDDVKNDYRKQLEEVAQ